MSFAIQKSLTTKGLNPGTQNFPDSTTGKNLGPAGDAAGLAAWYEEAYNYYNAVMSGSEPQPDPAAWTQLQQWMQWAQQQLNGGGAGAWDPMAGGDPLGAGAGEEDPFGGTTGPLGSIVHSEMDVRLGFTADGKVHDIFAYNFTLDVASPAATVTAEKTTDTRTQPPEEVVKIVVKDPTTGGETVYMVHSPGDLENLIINSPKGKKVTDLTGGLVQIGEFVEGAAGNGGGIPEGGSIEGKNATFDGMGNQTYKFEPPFGGLEQITCNANADITVMNSDQVTVEQNSDGSYRLTIEREDGTQVVFNIPEGFAVNLNANAHNVTFKDGGNGGGDINDIRVAGDRPQRTSPQTNGEDGIPTGWENFSLNGQSAPEEPEGGVDTSEWPPKLIDLLEEMGFEPEDYGSLNITDDLIEEIEGGVTPPSKGFIEALVETDTTLKAAWERVQSDPQDDHSWKQFRNRLATLLGKVFPDVSKSGEFPEGFEVDTLMENKSIFFGDDAYEITDALGFKRIDETTGSEETESETNNIARTIAEDLAARPYMDPEMTADKILEKAEEMGIDLGLIHLSFPPSNQLMQLLFEIDPTFKAKLDHFTTVSVPSENDIVELREELGELLEIVYAEAGYTFRGHLEDNTGHGKDDRENDMAVEKNGERISSWNIFTDDMDNHGYDGNPWEIFTWDQIL